MNKKMVVVVVAGILMASAVGVVAAILNSGHDLSGQAWNTKEDVCGPCHVPHGANATQPIPLWGHTNTANAGSFQVYTSTTMNVVPGQPSGASLACLSCHDGSVAVDAFGGATGTYFITGSKLLDTDLRNDHPVSFNYWSSTDTELKNDANVTNLLVGGTQVECASCHDPHNGTASVTNLLIMSNADSALCLTCHDK